MTEPNVSADGQVRAPTVDGLPGGYRYGVTRFADVILQQAYLRRFEDLRHALELFRPTLTELRTGGGGRTVFVKRFDDSLADTLDEGQTVWGKQTITIKKQIEFNGDLVPLSRVRGHEIDMFGVGLVDEPIPGIAVEMEWNNKDPFFDRDLINFQALHREGAIAVGVIVTRGPALQHLICDIIRSQVGGLKYGTSTTHWDKLVPRVNLGGGGECPLLLVGIEPDRIDGIELVAMARSMLDKAETFKLTWRETHERWSEAKPIYESMRAEALDLVPPMSQ